MNVLCFETVAEPNVTGQVTSVPVLGGRIMLEPNDSTVKSAAGDLVGERELVSPLTQPGTHPGPH
jgi:hypothetical protein